MKNVQSGKFLKAVGARIDVVFHIVQLLYDCEVALKLSFINKHRWLQDPTTDSLYS